jgi:hypothetical protein
MPYVKSLRPVRIATLSGHVVDVVAMKPTFVPAPAYEEARAAGCVMCDEHGKIIVEDGLGSAALHDDPDEIPFLPPEERDVPEKRVRVIKLAVLKCFKRNSREDFGANGVPKAQVVTRMIGFQVTAGEVAEATEALKSVDD